MKGLYLDGKKDASLLAWTIRRPPTPPKVYIPLKQGISVSNPCLPLGSKVRLGDKIALPADSKSVSLHASMSGTVSAVLSHPHPFYGQQQTIEITAGENTESAPGFGVEREGWKELSSKTLVNLFRENGLVDLTPEMIPVHYKITANGGSAGKTLVFNASESEPYLTADQILLMSHVVEIIRGAEIIRNAAGAVRIIFVVDKNQEQAAELLRSKIYLLKWDHCEVKILSSQYPQNHPQVLGETLLKDGPGEAEPSDYVLFNVATAYAAYEAIALSKPLVERIVTMGGECIVDSKNLRLPLGMTLEDSLKACRGLLREPRKLLVGGPMRGVCQTDLSVPVVPGSQAVLALPKEVASPEEVQPCIRCGDCVDACPVSLSPVMITLAAERDLFDSAKLYGVEACIECGNCSYVCPSKRPMLELIRYAATRLHLTPVPSSVSEALPPTEKLELAGIADR